LGKAAGGVFNAVMQLLSNRVVTKKMMSSIELLTDWLVGKPVSAVFLKTLTLLDAACIYIVNGEQRVVHWSVGLEKLTGFSAKSMSGQPCPKELVITASYNDNEQRITLSSMGDSGIRVKQQVQVFRNAAGFFEGGIGLLIPDTESIGNSRSAQVSATAKQNFHGILSRSPAMQAVFQIIENAAETEATVLVRGESGAGKELVAKAIHSLSARCNAPFLAINCAALSSSLLDSELFGHVRGAFTGAIKDHNGLFQRAQGGTLFLDEVAELPLELQAKLLRVIQERNYIPVGGDRSIAVDVRLVAATHRSLREQVKNGLFREDLMYRLRVVPIFIPPLRERREDVSLLLWHFIQLHNAENFRRIEKIDPPAMQLLLDYAWPGNVRELHNVVEYAFAVGRGTTLRLTELPPEFREQRSASIHPAPRQNLPQSAEQQASAIRQALEQSHGVIAPAAQLLGMSRATFWRKRKTYGI
jgi:transcriptional regulator with PAS, ATPase and Fis domain